MQWFNAWYCPYSVAVGEPPLLMSSGVLFALKRAVESARSDAGNNDPFSLSKFMQNIVIK